MSGIVGWVRRACNERGASPDFGRTLGVLCHGPRFRSSVVHEGDGVALGAVLRAEPPLDVWRDPDRYVVVLVYGRPLVRSGPWRLASAEEIGARYMARGVAGVEGLDGSFSLAILDTSRGTLYMVNDRTASIPVLYAEGPRGVVIGPEAKVLFGLSGISPCLSEAGAVSFLSLGYPVGNRTIFEGVWGLPPASVLAVDIKESRVSVRKWWDLRFEPEEHWRMPDAVAALDTALLEAHRSVLLDGPERVHLLLTGGYDSRTVLGYLGAVGRPPREALTWGVRPDLPASDPAIAGEIAASQGVSFRFLQYGAERFAQEASRWAWIGELTSDNTGNYATGPDFFERAGVDPDVPVLIGDQMLGPGGFPRSQVQAMENITRIPWGGIPQELGAVMTPDGAHRAGEILASSIEEVIADSPSDHPKDVQDYLYFHLYVVRWLHAPAYFREPMVSPRRPLLLEPVLEVGRRLPRRFRIDKRVLVDLLSRKMPSLSRFPIASAHSLVDWDAEMRTSEDLRLFILAHLEWEIVGRTPLAAVLDRARYLQVVKRFFSSTPRPVRRRPSPLPWAMRWRRRLAGVPWLQPAVQSVEPLARKVLGAETARSTGIFLRRLALLALLQEMIDAETFAQAPAGAAGACESVGKTGA